MGGLQPVTIKWTDISTIGEWVDVSELDEVLKNDDADRFYAIGFLIEDNDDLVRIAANVCVDKNNKPIKYADITTIRKTPIEYIQYKE